VILLFGTPFAHAPFDRCFLQPLLVLEKPDAIITTKERVGFLLCTIGEDVSAWRGKKADD
jgi:hypothetical protein